MKIDVYSVMHNEEIILPYWLRHYETFADRIFIWDDASTDATRQILSKHPKVTFLPMEKFGDNDDYWVASLFPQYEQISRGVADWVIIADADEFIYHPNIREALEKAKERGSKIIGCQGFTMVSEGLPTTNGQIYDEIKMGLPDALESKWTIHDADTFVRYGRGRHVKPNRKMRTPLDDATGIKLLHYRYLGPEFYESRDKRNLERNKLAYGYEEDYVPDKTRRLPDRTAGSGIDWHKLHKNEAVNVVDDGIITLADPLVQADFWRATMYTRLKESLGKESTTGEGVEFGGSNGIIQSMLPGVSWETRSYPQHDVTKQTSYERNWDVIVTDQVLEHTEKPWEAMRLMSEHASQMVVLTVPFLIRIHNSPGDFWRMTPRTIHMLAKPYFKDIDIQTWGSVKANYWHALYNRTNRLIDNVDAAELEAELNGNDGNHPFVIWAILKK